MKYCATAQIDRFSFLAFFIALHGTILSAATIHLKTEDLPRNHSAAVSAPLSEHTPFYWRVGRAHYLVEFTQPIDSNLLNQIAATGLQVTGGLSRSGAVVSGNQSAIDRLDVNFTAELQPEDKISPLVATVLTNAPYELLPFLVEFHPDVAPDDALGVLNNAGFPPHPSPALRANHYLVYGPVAAITQLVRWDEVAYVFPASYALFGRERLHACAGPLMAAGPMGQYALAGQGWLPGSNGIVQLDFVFESLTSKLPAALAQQALEKAFHEWAQYAPIDFQPGSDSNANQTVAVLFASRDHGDGYPFDGPGGVLAHTFYPAPLNPEPIAGNMHFDADEDWHLGQDTDFYTVALHETGHALGLAHSDQPDSVMYPYYSPGKTLTADDIAGLQALYGPPLPTEAPPSTPASTPGVPAIPVTPPSVAPATPAPPINHTPAQPPVIPPGITPSVPAGNGGSKENSGPPVARVSVTILPPAGPLVTSRSSVDIAGTADSSAGGLAVTWTTSQGATGRALGGNLWQASGIPLGPDKTVITVTATDASGQAASATLVLSQPAAASPQNPAIPDTVAPVLTITSPLNSIVSVTDSSTPVSGNASDNVGVTSVTWQTSLGYSGSASGLQSWTAVIPLAVGNNNIVITASDAAGNTRWQSLTVVRY